MNKGLYQFSYEKVEVDRKKNEVRLSRRTKEKPEFTLLSRVGLSPTKSKREVWQIPAQFSGAILLPAKAVGKEYRWDDGAWIPLAGTALTTEKLIPGEHRLTVRTNQNYFHCGVGVSKSETPSVLQENWRVSLPGGVMSHLGLVQDSLLVSCMDGSLIRLNKKTGQPIWSTKMAGYCHSSPTFSDGIVVVGCSDGFVRGFSFENGKELWRHQTDGPVYASAAVAKGIVGIASGDGTVRGLNLIDGTHKWTQKLPPSNSNFIQSPATTDGERFYMGAWDSHLYAFDVVTGEQVFRAGCCADRSFAYSPAIGGPAIVNDLVVVPANGNVLYAFDRKTGKEAWQATSPGDKFGYSSPTFDGQRIVCGCLGSKGEFRAVDPTNGKILWTAATGADIYDSSPCIGNGWTAVGSVAGILSVASVDTGAILGQTQLPIGHILASPVAQNDHVYAATYGDLIAAFKVARG
jgi:outer membrane protein assembly factor BamB